MKCSFCGSETGTIIAGGTDRRHVYICDTCIESMSRMIEAQRRDDEASDDIYLGYMVEEIKMVLDEAIIGQERAKRILSIAVYNHLRRIENGTGRRSNILMIGPTGCGKTLFAKTIAEKMHLPYVIADCSNLTQTGYIGGSVDDVLARLVHSANGSIRKAEKGIIFLDEIDKLARNSDRGNGDPSGVGVQQCLLKILDGDEIQFCADARSHRIQTIDTKNILFICSGAFPGIKKEKSVAGIGFLGTTNERNAKQNGKIVTEDLVQYGLIPEFVGRLPVIIQMEELTKSDLREILETQILPEYAQIFEEYETELVFSDGAIEHILDDALSRGTGARGLRGSVDSILADHMYTAATELMSKLEIKENLRPLWTIGLIGNKEASQ